MQYDKTYSLCLSILLHVLVLSLFFVTLKHVNHYRVPGVTKPVMGFVVPMPRHHEQSVTHKKKTVARKGLAIEHQQVQPQSKAKPRLVKPQHKALSGKTLNKLIVLLYQAINQHKVYPDMAQQLGQTGVVQIGFMLHRDGALTQVHIVKSSGFNDLDAAALQAVQSAAPVVGVAQFVKQSQDFVIPIQFSQ
jgi:TonB family protein